MKFSIQWLEEYLGETLDPTVLADQLTLSGSEVESVEPAAAEFSGVVVGQIESATPHPDAKRLHCCRVNVGQSEPLAIVCGGVNVREQLKVAVAIVGAHLPGDIHIQATQLRGQDSHGMICAAAELGLGDDEKGHILELAKEAPIGEDLRQYWKLEDTVIDVALTANRGDCLSIRGIAREAAALKSQLFEPIKIASISEKHDKTRSICLHAPEQCPRYVGRIIQNIHSKAMTPIFIQERLRRSGIRSIHPVVDVTNYVMLELGQPMHAFDLQTITGGIDVRMAQSGESLTLLDSRELSLKPDALVIADEKKPLALAGIMGGLESAVSDQTTDIFLESAFFQPIPLSLTARRYGLQSDSAHRFARGVDFNLAREAMERVTALLLELVGGEAGPVIEQTESTYLPSREPILLRRSQIKRLLGIELKDSKVTHILESLGMTVTKEQEKGWLVTPPSYRFDLTREVDFIEELGRLYGYQHLPSATMNMGMRLPEQPEQTMTTSRLLSLLIDRDYHEAITYSFVDPRYQACLDPQHKPIPLKNPISGELSVMRTTLWPGLLQALQYNQNRQASRVRLFETGLCFLGTEEDCEQIQMLGGAVSGTVYPEQWGVSNRPVDFFDVKKDIEGLLALTGRLSAFEWRPSDHPALHPGQSADVYLDQKRVGCLGALHPLTAQRCDIEGVIYLFELKLNLINSIQPIQFKEISKFPSVRRDIAITVSSDVLVGEIRQFIEEKAGNLLNYVQIFDVYQGDRVELGKKSVALGLIFQTAARTLKDEEIQTIVDHLINGLKEHFDANLRA